MTRSLSSRRDPARVRRPGALALAVLLVVALAGGADFPSGAARPAGGGGGLDTDALLQQARKVTREVTAWYQDTPPADRVTWGGLTAAALLGVSVVLERTVRLRKRKVLPAEFTNRFLARLRDGKLDRGKSLDFCELNPSPASRVALAAVRRWGRPTADLERAASLAHRVEADGLRRNVGTLRRVAALTPLVGLLGTLMATGRALAGLGAAGTSLPAAWGPALASALVPLTVGVAVAVVALVAYDGLSGRVESLVAGLDRVGAETIDAISMTLPPDPRPASAAGPARAPHPQSHPVRLEIPARTPRVKDDADDFD